MTGVPYPHGVVAEDDHLFAAMPFGVGMVHLMVILDPFEAVGDGEGGLFVVALDEVDLAVEAVEDAGAGLDVAEGEVPEVIDLVIGADYRVPVGDEDLVHVAGGAEWAVGVFDDVGVAEMGVGGEVGGWSRIY